MNGEVITVARPATPAVSGFTAELFDRWTRYIDASPRTVETYNKAVRQFLSYLKDNGISQPAREDVISFKEYMASTHKPTTAQGYLMAVKQFFKWTQMEGLYPNVADNVKAVKLDKGHKKDYLTSGQVKGLLSTSTGESLSEKRDYAVLALMVTSGLRTVEVARANIEDMRTVADFTALYIQGKGHTEKTDYVKLTQPVENAIRSYLKARGKTSGAEPLFSSISNRDKGQRMTTRSISRIVKGHLLEAGLDSDRLTAHSLRHTTATLNLLNGGSIEETQQLLRHTSINTTMIYSHALERANNNSEQRISNAIFG
jgi:integrase/recombinase XerC